MVSGMSAIWNSVGEYVAHDLFRLEYILARVAISVIVSLLWNFPMQRYFVFRAPPSS